MPTNGSSGRILLRMRFGSLEAGRRRYQEELRHGVFFLHTQSPRPVGTTVRLQLDLGDDGPPIRLDAEVVSTIELMAAESSGVRPGMTIRFALGPEVHETLQERLGLRAPAAPAPASRGLDALLAAHREQDHYALLGVPRDAGRAEIREAFLELVRCYHPERFRHTVPAERLAAIEEAYAHIARAYETLVSGQQRIAYDLSLGYLGGNRDGIGAAEMRRRAAEAKRQSVSIRQMRCAEKLFLQASEEVATGRMKQAVATLRLALALHPESMALQEKLRELTGGARGH